VIRGIGTENGEKWPKIVPILIYLVEILRFNLLLLWKPSRDFTRPLGPPGGLKGLLHTPNETVIPTKVMHRMRCQDTNQATRKHLKLV
ncbi:hypothetical protein Tco_1516027, partial [Tanacetum coccineum]